MRQERYYPSLDINKKILPAKMSSYKNIARRKQRCRYIVYFVVSLVLVTYALLDIVKDGVNGAENDVYRSRHLLQDDEAENGSDDQPNKYVKGASVISEFINASNNLTQSEKNESSDNDTACDIPSIAEFPSDLFTQKQRKHGAVIVHVIVAIYMCVGLGIVCDYYFVPSLEVLCHKLRIQADVAGASLMAIGSSAPELCASIIGVFVTKGDIGIGTILGSAVFNLLFVIGICGICATTDLKLSWWPITRDTLAYALTIVVLSIVIFDSSVKWQEAVTMLVLYTLYLVFMSQNQRIEKSFYLFIGDTKSYKQRFDKPLSEETTPLTPTDIKDEIKETWLEESGDKNGNDIACDISETSESSEDDDEGFPDDPPENIITYPDSKLMKLAWVVNFPMKLLFFLTIPDLRRPRCRGLVLLTFFMSISWIGFLTYTLVWMVTMIGFTIDIPDSVMGLTLVTFGSSVPDALASMIVAKQGKGNMAVSQALGSNVFDILLGLGLPWAIKSLQKDSTIKIQSVGMLISCFVTFILSILVLLTLYMKKFMLGRKIGMALMIAYVLYLIAAVITELFLYKDYRLPICDIPGLR